MKKTKKPKKPSLLALSKIPEDPATAGEGRQLCQDCGLFRQTTNPFLNPPPNPKWTGKLLLIGEAPGREEEQSGKFFVGRAGKLLHEYLTTNAFRPPQDGAVTDVEIWNAVRCRPKDNATPSMEQVRCCRPYVLHRINLLKPKVVLAMGVTAAKSVFNSGDASITKHRGRPRELEEGESDVQSAQS